MLRNIDRRTIYLFDNLKIIIISAFLIFTKKLNHYLRMDQLYTISYEGISQLLAYSPWNKDKKVGPDMKIQNQIHSPKSPKIGFVKFKLSNSEAEKEENDSACDSEAAEKDQDSDILEQKQKRSEQSQKKQQSQNVKTRKGPYKKYTMEQKLQAIQMINSGKDIKTVSKQFNIPRRNLLRWRKNGCQRKQGGGRPSDFIMQEKLFDMILKRQVTTEKQIREYALNMTNFKKFKASKGWYVKFWRRFHEYTARTIKKQDKIFDIVKNQQ